MSATKRQQLRPTAGQQETTAEHYARRHGTEAQSGRLPFVAMKARMSIQQGYKTAPSAHALPHTRSLPHGFMSSADTLAHAQATIAISNGKRPNELQPFCAAIPGTDTEQVVRQTVTAAASRKRRTETDDGSDTEVEDDSMDVEPSANVRDVRPLRRSARALPATRSAPALGNDLAKWVGRDDF